MAGDFKIRVGVDFDDSELNQIENRIRSIGEKPVKIDIDFGNSQSQLDKLTNSIKNIGKNTKATVDVDFKADKTSVDRATKETVSSLKTKLNNANADISKLELQMKQLGNSGNGHIEKAIKSAKELRNELGKNINTASIEDSAAGYKELANNIKFAASEIKEAQSKLKLNLFDDKLDMKRQKYKNAMDMFLKDNPKMRGSIFEKQYMKIRVDLDTGKSEQELDQLMNKARLVQQTAKVNGKTGDTLISGLGKTAKSMLSFASVGSILYGVSDAFRMMGQNVLEVDTAMTELKRVTDLSGLQYENLYSKLTVSAKEYGVQLTDLISATADWSRAGFEADVAAGLAEVTSVYQHIADLDYGEASENLLTAYKGFEGQLTQEFNGNAVEAVSYVADVFNELDKYKLSIRNYIG